MGGHAVKLIGWGTDVNGLYWICANQWNVDWGESGYFNIYEGEAAIAGDAIGCEPELKYM